MMIIIFWFFAGVLLVVMEVVLSSVTNAFLHTECVYSIIIIFICIFN